MTETITRAAGIDTAKAKLDVAVHGRAVHWQFENAPKGWRQLTAALAEAGIGPGAGRVGIEATGGYEQGVVRHLRAAGLSVVVLQPVQVRAYAKLHLRRAKNDALDAALIAAVTALGAMPERETDGRLGEIAPQLTFVEQAEEDIARLKTRREQTRDPRLRKLIGADIARLGKRRAAELGRIAAALRAHPDLARRLELVQSVPGIGERTAIAIVVRMPELGRVSREEAAALAGLAPFDDQSGDQSRPRRIAGGRGRLRRSLYAAALPAAFRWNPALIAFYRRLTDAGAAHKKALTACARKLLVYANTVVSRGTPWVMQPDRA